jgi:hypothetical protein
MVGAAELAHLPEVAGRGTRSLPRAVKHVAPRGLDELMNQSHFGRVTVCKDTMELNNIWQTRNA